MIPLIPGPITDPENKPETLPQPRTLPGTVPGPVLDPNRGNPGALPFPQAQPIGNGFNSAR
jgi:hypothetical protein